MDKQVAWQPLFGKTKTFMNLLLLIVFFTAVGGVLSVIAASLFLLLSEKWQEKILPHGISLATGALLTVAFWGLIPEAFEQVNPAQFQAVSGVILLGILGFFILEKLLIWRHCHASHCHAHTEEAHSHDHSSTEQHSAGTLILIGDAIHNFVDGVLIGAAFLTDPQLGIMSSLAVATHEIPQEVGDFAILLQSGYSKKKALIYNVLASFTTVIGGVLAYFALADLKSYLPYFLALAASSFIYIAVADLIPSLHEKTDIKTSLQQIFLILAGVVLIGWLHDMAHHLEIKSPNSR